MRVPCLSLSFDLLGRKHRISSLLERQPHVVAREGAIKRLSPLNWESALGGLVGTFIYLFFYVYECLAYVYVCAPCACLVPQRLEAGAGWIPWR